MSDRISDMMIQEDNLFMKVNTPEQYPEHEGYYYTDSGEIYYNGEYWVTNQNRDDSFEYPSWFMNKIKLDYYGNNHIIVNRH